MIRLETVIYDKRARDGTWCKLPYPNHPNGCPNFPLCPNKYQDLSELNNIDWYAVIEEFDLKAHAESMKARHPDWTDRQCRNLLYWQNGVRKRLREKAYRNANGGIVLEIPEACGVNLFATMSRVGIRLKRNPDLIKKIMLVGLRK
jgi:hypothetical protein